MKTKCDDGWNGSESITSFYSLDDANKNKFCGQQHELRNETTKPTKSARKFKSDKVRHKHVSNSNNPKP